MHAHAPSPGAETKRHRPRMTTVFGASFLAGAVLAFGVNRVLDVHVTQAQPQVECEPIFVALRSLPQGAPVTVWDVALRDWPKAMLPTTALKSHDSFAGTVLKYPVREGQPLLSVQLVRDASLAPPTAVAEAAAPVTAPTTLAAATPSADAWLPTPAEPVAPPAPSAVEPTPAAPPAVTEPAPVDQAATPASAEPQVPTEDFEEAEVTDLVAVDATPAPATAPATSVTGEPTPATEPTPAGEPTPAAEPTPADTAVPTLAAEPTPAGEPTLADAGSLPFAAPVPALPPTDIGESLAEVGAARSRLSAEPPPAPRTDSVLADAASPAATPSGPKRYLVVPERIALQADASFVDQRPTAPQPAARTAAADPAPSRSRTATAGTRPTGSAARPQSATTGSKRSASPPREATPEKKPVPRGGGWFSGTPQAWGGIGAALRRPQADQAPGGPR